MNIVTKQTVMPDLKEIEATLRLFVQPGGIGEIRVIGGSQNGSGQYGYYFSYDEIPQAAKLAWRDTQHSKGTYVVLNEISSELSDRPRLEKAYQPLTKDKDIARRRFFFIDFDPDRAAEESSSDEEKEQARALRDVVYEYLRQAQFPDPVFADSGNGFHLIYAIDLPNDDSASELLKAFLNFLDRKFTIPGRMKIDKSVHNASRITKLYGTLARKGMDTPERPHRISRIEDMPDGGMHPVSRELLEAVIAGGALSRFESFTHEPEDYIGEQFVSTTPINATSGYVIPEQIHAGDRHAAFLSHAGYLRAAGAGYGQILHSLRYLNENNCVNPKSDSELQQIARDYSVKDVNLGMAALMHGTSEADVEAAKVKQHLKQELQNATKQLNEGATVQELAAKLKRMLSAVEEHATLPEAAADDTLTSQQLDDAICDLEYLIPDLLVKGQPAIWAGGKKCLKTNTLIDLQLSLASGCWFLGKFPVVRPVRVALISGESGQGTIQETARRIAKSKNWINLRDYENALWRFNLPKLGQPGTVKAIVDYVQKHKLEVLILDPAYLCMPLGESASNLFLVGEMLSDLSKVSEQTGVTLILCHHTRRSTVNQFDPPELDLIAWAGFQEWARQWILIGRRSAYRPDSNGEHELWLASGGSAGHSGLWAVDIEEGTRRDGGTRKWVVDVKKPYEARQEAQEAKEQAKELKAQSHLNRDRQRMQEAYRSYPAGETSRVIRDTAGVSGTKFTAINAEFLRLGWIERCEVVKLNKTYEAFRLTPVGQVGQVGFIPLNPSRPGEDVMSGTASPLIGDALSHTSPRPTDGFSDPTIDVSGMEF